VLVIVAFIAWRPVLAEYRHEHPPANFAFIVPGVVLYGPQKVGWLFLINRRGLDTLFNVEIYFRDMDLVNSWTGRKSLNEEEVRSSEVILKYPEIDPGVGVGFAREFQWAPYNLEHSHFWTRISFRGGRIDEEFRVEKTAKGMAIPNQGVGDGFKTSLHRLPRSVISDRGKRYSSLAEMLSRYYELLIFQGSDQIHFCADAQNTETNRTCAPRIPAERKL
jgi:hypothetical protein